MNSHEFLVTRQDGVVTIDLNRPDEGNALTMPMLDGLRQLVTEAGNDPEARLVVIMGRGPEFCRGRDNKGHKREGMSVLQVHEQVMGRILGFYGSIRNCPIPVVARVHGPARAFGCALAGAADYTFASTAATFKLDEIEHGSPSTLAMSSLVSRVPRKALAWLVCSAEALDAHAAVAAGLVSRVYDAAEFEKKADEAIALLASRPRIALTTVKKFLARAPELDPEMASDFAGALHAMVRTK